jgi:hypothetical protein
MTNLRKSVAHLATNQTAPKSAVGLESGGGRITRTIGPMMGGRDYKKSTLCPDVF